MAAVEMGYLDDSFAQFFVNGPAPKRYPIINRGTYVRTTAIDRLVNRFLATRPELKKQIISLGAGSDTRFFRLCAPDRKNVVYHELDFDVNTMSKITKIDQIPLLKKNLISTLENSTSLRINEDRTALYSDTLNVHSIDLRSLATSSTSSGSIHLPNLDPDLPTLIISECCLCYIPPESTSAILSFFLSLLKSAVAIILYEPIRPNDSFGRVMVSNLSSRGIELRTVKKYGTLTSQRERLKHAGFAAGQGARSVESIYYGEQKDGEMWLPDRERMRVERLEWLDEVEEWRLLASHYCISWAWRHAVDSNDSSSGIFDVAWEDIKGDYNSAEDSDE